MSADPPPETQHSRDPGPESQAESNGSGRHVLNHREAVEFTRLVGRMASAGIALPGGLRALAEESESHRVRLGMLRVADRIEQGESLGTAIAAEGRSLPEHLIGIAQAAERSGKLSEVFAEASRLERTGIELSQQLILRLAYPVLLLFAFAALFQLVGAFATVAIESIFEDFGIQLPALSLGLMTIARFVTQNPWVIPSLLVLNGLLFWQATRGGSERLRRRVASRVPLFGPLWKNAALSEFTALLSLLVECRLPMPEVLNLAGRGTRDPDLISACLGASLEVEAGRSLTDAFRDYRILPRGADPLIAWAEYNETLPDALRLAAETFAARARTQATMIGMFISTSVSFFLVAAIILTILGLYLPMLQLFGGLTGGMSLLW